MEQSVGQSERKTRINYLHVAELRMLRWIKSKTGKYHVRNQVIHKDAKVCQMPTFLRQKRLNWYRHIRRREEDNISRKMMDMVVPRMRKRGGQDGDGLINPGGYEQIRTGMTEHRQY